MSKFLGQHFLKNQDVIQKIVSAAEISRNETIIEIGPGEGALTLPLLAACKKVGAKLIAIEKDEALAESLMRNSQLVTSNWGAQIIAGDALRVLPQLITNYQLPVTAYKIIGNIPYYITGYLLRIIGELEPKPLKIILMIQREVAERLIAKPPKMNLLAAATGIWAEPKIIAHLAPEDFEPAPKVESAVVQLLSRSSLRLNSSKTAQLFNSATAPKAADYYQVIHAAFKQPRKTLLNNLASSELGLTKEKTAQIIAKIGLLPSARPQDLSLESIYALAGLLAKQ